jgi:hypothetical protein
MLVCKAPPLSTNNRPMLHVELVLLSHQPAAKQIEHSQAEGIVRVLSDGGMLFQLSARGEV